MGFEVPQEVTQASNLEQAFSFIDYWDVHRHELPHETDGAVKVTISISRQLATAKLYRHANEVNVPQILLNFYLPSKVMHRSNYPVS
jgi:hypothetical protein